VNKHYLKAILRFLALFLGFSLSLSHSVWALRQAGLEESQAHDELEGALLRTASVTSGKRGYSVRDRSLLGKGFGGPMQPLLKLRQAGLEEGVTDGDPISKGLRYEILGEGRLEDLLAIRREARFKHPAVPAHLRRYIASSKNKQGLVTLLNAGEIILSLVAVGRAGETVGHIIFETFDTSRNGSAFKVELTEIAVRKEYQENGIGTMLLQETIGRLQRAVPRPSAILLNNRSDDDWSVRIAQEFGFKPAPSLGSLSWGFNQYALEINPPAAGLEESLSRQQIYQGLLPILSRSRQKPPVWVVFDVDNVLTQTAEHPIAPTTVKVLDQYGTLARERGAGGLVA